MRPRCHLSPRLRRRPACRPHIARPSGTRRTPEADPAFLLFLLYSDKTSCRPTAATTTLLKPPPMPQPPAPAPATSAVGATMQSGGAVVLVANCLRRSDKELVVNQGSSSVALCPAMSWPFPRTRRHLSAASQPCGPSPGPSLRNALTAGGGRDPPGGPRPRAWILGSRGGAAETRALRRPPTLNPTPSKPPNPEPFFGRGPIKPCLILTSAGRRESASWTSPPWRRLRRSTGLGCLFWNFQG